MFQQTLIIFLAIIGFFLSLYIHRKTARQERLVCMLGESCNKVVYSQYARTLGISNTFLGMLYYGFVIISYALLFAAPHVFTPLFSLAIQSSIGLAAFFSVYLIFVQIIMLKEWCEWCMASSFISLAIFALAFL